MIDIIPDVLVNYGVLGVWTFTLLWDRNQNNKIYAEERKETTNVIRQTSMNMALVNDNLKEIKNLLMK